MDGTLMSRSFVINFDSGSTACTLSEQRAGGLRASLWDSSVSRRERRKGGYIGPPMTSAGLLVTRLRGDSAGTIMGPPMTSSLLKPPPGDVNENKAERRTVTRLMMGSSGGPLLLVSGRSNTVSRPPPTHHIRFGTSGSRPVWRPVGQARCSAIGQTQGIAASKGRGTWHKGAGTRNGHSFDISARTDLTRTTRRAVSQRARALMSPSERQPQSPSPERPVIVAELGIEDPSVTLVQSLRDDVRVGRRQRQP
jgi:hypothetical protein